MTEGVEDPMIVNEGKDKSSSNHSETNRRESHDPNGMVAMETAPPKISQTVQSGESPHAVEVSSGDEARTVSGDIPEEPKPHKDPAVGDSSVATESPNTRSEIPRESRDSVASTVNPAEDITESKYANPTQKE